MKTLITLLTMSVCSVAVAQQPGTTAPAFTLTDPNGVSYSLGQFEGKVVVLFFLGHACPFCKASAPSVTAEIHQAYSSSQLQVLGIDQWNGSPAQVQSFISQTATPYPVLTNGQGTAQKFNTTYDRLFVIDHEGIVRFKGTMQASGDLNNAIAVINQYVGFASDIAVTGTDEQKNRVYYDPNVQQLYYDLAHTLGPVLGIDLYNLVGQPVWQAVQQELGSDNKVTLPHHIGDGLYLVVIRTQLGWFTTKVALN